MPTNHVSKALAAPPRRRFVLAGHSAPLDPAKHAVRDDLADVALADRVFAPHYVEALSGRILQTEMLYDKADVFSTALGSIASGAQIDVFDFASDWAWVRSDKGIGYVHAASVSVA